MNALRKYMLERKELQYQNTVIKKPPGFPGGRYRGDMKVVGELSSRLIYPFLSPKMKRGSLVEPERSVYWKECSTKPMACL